MSVELIYPRPPLRTISQAQLDQFRADGYLLFPGVLGADDLASITAAVDRIHARFLAGGAEPSARMDALGVARQTADRWGRCR